MSVHRLRTRLERLSPSISTDGARDFTIDQTLAKALRDDKERLNELLRKRYAPSQHGGPLTAAEVEEESNLPARIAERARTIVLPVGYGAREALRDANRLVKLFYKRITPPCGGGPLTEAEDAEEAQLTAQVAAFAETTEGRALRRIRDLEVRGISAVLSDAEQNELESLQKLYPGPSPFF
jgi:hypothetical protein